MGGFHHEAAQEQSENRARVRQTTIAVRADLFLRKRLRQLSPLDINLRVLKIHAWQEHLQP